MQIGVRLRGLLGVRVVQVELVEVRRRAVLVELDGGLEWFVEHERALAKGGEAGESASVSISLLRRPSLLRADGRTDGRCHVRRFPHQRVAASSPLAASGVASVTSRTSLGWSWRQPALAGRAVPVPAGQRGLEVALGLVEADQAAAV